MINEKNENENGNFKFIESASSNQNGHNEGVHAEPTQPNHCT